MTPFVGLPGRYFLQATFIGIVSSSMHESASHPAALHALALSAKHLPSTTWVQPGPPGFTSWRCGGLSAAGEGPQAEARETRAKAKARRRIMASERTPSVELTVNP